MLLRITNARGVDLTFFDFDYDLTWMAFFINADRHVYGRFGGRDADHAEKSLSLKGLKHALRAALDSYKTDPKAKAEPITKRFRTVEQYPGAQRVKNNKCIHCHQVRDFDREWLVQQRKWSTEEIWTYPPPDNLGLILDADQGNRVKSVTEKSAAEATGIRAGDVLESLAGKKVHSYGDVQYRLHWAPKTGKLAITWDRAGTSMKGALELKEGWRESDISWRASMWGLEPKAHVYGKDLTTAEKRKLGLSPKQLAFRQGKFVPARSRQAGVRSGDVIFGASDKKLEMTMLQFNVWVRLNFRDGDRIVYNLYRNGKRMDVPLILQSRTSR